MVSLNEKFINLSSFSNVSLPEKPIVKTEKISEQKAENDKNYINKYVVPFCMIAGGGILVYLGLKRPDKDIIFNKAINHKVEQMQGHLEGFKKFVKNIIEKSYKEADNYISAYKENYSYNIIPELSSIRIASEPENILYINREAFKKIEHLHCAENNRAGATIFDRFIISIGKETEKLSKTVWDKKCELGMKCEDIIHFIFDDYNNLDNIYLAQGRLRARKYLTDLDMDLYRKKAFEEILNIKSKPMAQAIIDSREAFLKAKENIIDASFETIRKVLNLPESFEPQYNKLVNISDFKNLKSEGLKPQKISARIKNIFDNNPVWETVLSSDFANISKNDFVKLFGQLSPDFGIQDIRMMADYLRLSNVADKYAGKNHEKLYKNLIAKLEFLSNQLKIVGEKELMNACNLEYFKLKPEALRYKFSYLNDISMKLGFSSLEKMDEYYLRNNPDFINAPVRKYLSLIKSNPELYFS